MSRNLRLQMVRIPSHSDDLTRHRSSIGSSPDEDRVLSVRYIGCCGAYCRTCAGLKEGVCRGCKLGYGTGARDLARAKCAMKVCCFREKHLETCADCSVYGTCERIQTFHAHKGYKYKKYKQSIEFIREKGYLAFLQLASRWKGPYGKLE
jgi:hypothetical protein